MGGLPHRGSGRRTDHPGASSVEPWVPWGHGGPTCPGRLSRAGQPQRDLVRQEHDVEHHSVTGPQCRDGVLQRRFAGGRATTQFLPTVRHEEAAGTDRQAGEERGEKRRIDVPVAADQIGAVPGHRPALPRFRGRIRIRRELPVRAGQEIPVVVSTVVLADHERVATDRDRSPVAVRGVPRSSDVVPPAECHEGSTARRPVRTRIRSTTCGAGSGRGRARRPARCTRWAPRPTSPPAPARQRRGRPAGRT